MDLASSGAISQLGLSGILASQVEARQPPTAAITVLYQRPCPMTVFCDGIFRNGGPNIRAKKISGLGRWYYAILDRSMHKVVRLELADGGDG
jgi:hypothetical protein